VDDAEKLLPDKRAEIVVYCKNEECEASRQEARELEEIGYRDVSGRDHRLRYEAVFLDVDNTLLWVRVDAEGCVVDLSPYDTTGSLTAETATGLAWETLRRNIREHLKHRIKDDLAHFKRRNIERTAREFASDAAAVTILIVPTDEDPIIARHTRRLIKQEH
jgi:hypothetical protein